MMSRKSRVLKWVGAGAVVLIAAPIAYAHAHPGSTPPHEQSGPPQQSAWCGGDPIDFAGMFTVAGADDVDYNFDATTLLLTAMYLGRPVSAGSWQAGGGQITWGMADRSFLSAPGSATCSSVAHPAQVSSFTAISVDGRDTVTLRRVQ